MWAKFKFLTREVREYIVTITALLVFLQGSGVLDQLFPADTGLADIAAPIVADAALDEIDEFGRVVIDPLALDLVPFEQVDIGTAIVLECPFKEGCAAATMPPIESMPLPLTSGPAGFIPDQFFQEEPEVTFIDQTADLWEQYGYFVLVGFIVATIVLTSLFKRWRSNRT